VDFACKKKKKKKKKNKKKIWPPHSGGHALDRHPAWGVRSEGAGVETSAWDIVRASSRIQNGFLRLRNAARLVYEPNIQSGRRFPFRHRRAPVAYARCVVCHWQSEGAGVQHLVARSGG